MPYPVQDSCPRGHPYDAANTLHSAGKRYCRRCNVLKSTRRAHARRDRLREHRQAVEDAARAAGLSPRRWLLRVSAAALGRPDPWPSPRRPGRPAGSSMKRQG